MTARLPPHTHINEFRPLLKRLKLASKYCPEFDLIVIAEEFPDLAKKYKLLKNAVIKVFFSSGENSRFEGKFIVEQDEDLIIFHIFINERHFVAESATETEFTKNKIILRKAIAVHEYVHLLTHILSGNNSLLNIDLIKKIETDTFYMETKTNIPFNDQIPAVTVTNIIKETLKTLEQNNNDNGVISKAIISINKEKYIDSKFALDRILNELTNSKASSSPNG